MKIKKIISFLLLAAIIVNTVVLNPISVAAESFDAYETIIAEYDFEEELPDGLEIMSGMGSVGCEEINGRNAVFISSDIENGYTGIRKSFDTVTTGGVIVSFAFCQPNVKSIASKVMTIANGNSDILSLETSANALNVVYGEACETIIDDFALDTWINISITVDIDKKTFSVKKDGEDILSSVSLDISEINSIYSVSKYTNGFALDDILLKRYSQITECGIVGDDVISIPAVGKRSYEYSVLLVDNFENTQTDPNYTWSIDKTDGLKITENNGICTLTVSPECQDGNITLTAQHIRNSEIVLTRSIELRIEKAERIKILGDNHLTSFEGKNEYFQYTAVVYDEFGNEMIGEPVEWYIENLSSADITIDENTGKVCVRGNMPSEDEYAYVCVRLRADPDEFAKKKVVVQPNDFYYNDTMRFNAVKNSIDHILKYGTNRENTNPLIAGWLSPYTKEAGPIKYIGDETYTKYSDITMNFEMHRAMDALSAFTGDESYTNRVDEIYNYYLEKGISKDNLMYAGNHQSFDLDTGERSKYYTTVDDKHYMEIENRDFYSEPFLRNDKEKFVTFCEAFWSRCIVNWSTMVFNRHTLIKETATDTSVLDNTDAFDEDAQSGDFKLIPYVGLTFMSTGNILLKTARDAVNNGGNENLKLWGYRFLKRYMNTKNEDTNIFCTMFVSSMYSPGIIDLEKTYGKEWWTVEAGWKASKDYNAGDRGYNSFAQTVVDAGLISEDRKTEITEASLLENTSLFDRMSYEAYEFADFLGLDTPEGYDILKTYTECIASYINHAYDPKTNKFNVIFTNGINFTGVRWTRSGYWGAAGNSFKQKEMREGGFFTLMKAYEMTEGYEEFEDDREVIWNLLRNYLKYKYDIGDIGNPSKNIEPKLNLGVNTAEPLLIRVLIKLYDISGNKDYLRLARVIGNNIVVNKYRENMFIEDKKLRYVPLDGEYQYVLLLVEQAILGETGIVPESSYPNGYETQLSSLALKDNRMISWNNPEILTWSYNDVNVTDVIANVTSLELEVGQKEKITLTIKPDDATSKGVFWEIEDKGIVSVNEQNEVTGLKKGTTTLIAVSKSTVGVESEKITVTVK